ncbi:MAG: hypothetical protein HUK40_07120 [Desulfobacter sp.]|nr:hypothetical protein [Desulfobacter sp.]WDP84154.1 MAG: hypothetical protein HUN05_02430 [Desulfobacter sp.]
MGEIIGGVVFMGLFIAFAMWRGRKSGRVTDADSRLREDSYWAEKNEEESGSLFSFGAGNSGDHDGDDSRDD